MNQTNAIFDKTIVDNVVDGTLLENLQKDVFLFSGLKTHAQLLEASRLLLNDDHKIKTFSEFYKDVLKINTAYNRQYLEAEYQFAIASSQMANKWTAFSDDYNLQYRTAGDQRVRDSHNILRDTTLPKDDPFWDSFMPPNGWRCRCTAVEVLLEDYKVSDSKKAIAQGETATSQIGKDGKNKLEIFRFNPGKDKVVFPPAHPYNKVAGANVVKEVLTDKNNLKEQRTDIKNWAKENLVGKTVKHPKIEKPILFTSTGIKEALNQPHKHIIEKNEAIKNIKNLIKDAKFVKTDKDSKGRDIEYSYLKTVINKEDSFIIIKHQANRSSFYSIVEKLK